MKKLVSAALGLASAALAVGAVCVVAMPILFSNSQASGGVASVPLVLPRIIDGSAASIADTKDLSGVWEVGSDSTAGYHLTQTKGGASTTVTGHTDKVAGSMTISGQTITAATVSVDMASISTSNAAIDRSFTDRALDSDDFPTATFTLTSPVETASDPVAGQVQSLEASGTLTLHGVTRSVTVDLQLTVSTTGTRIEGDVPISFSDYGVTVPTLSSGSIDDSGALEFSLQATRP